MARDAGGEENFTNSSKAVKTSPFLAQERSARAGEMRLSTAMREARASPKESHSSLEREFEKGFQVTKSRLGATGLPNQETLPCTPHILTEAGCFLAPFVLRTEINSSASCSQTWRRDILCGWAVPSLRLLGARGSIRKSWPAR